MKDMLIVSPSPHVHSSWTVKKVMYGVVYAMLPAMLVSFYFFGLGSFIVTLVAVLSCILFEYLIQKYLLKGPVTVTDGSAIVTGMLLAFNVPAGLPWWMVIIGSLVAIGIGKMSFGGLGKNPFNPALVGRVFLLISFPVDMTRWPVIKPIFGGGNPDAVTGATFLGNIKEQAGALKAGETTISEIIDKGLPVYNSAGEVIGHQVTDYTQLLMGQMAGSLGEISALALLLGAAYMLFRKIITWHIPVAYIGSSVVLAGILWMVNPEMYLNPVYHLIAGGMMLGVFYMATDMVSSPMTHKAQIIYGIGCGVLTIVIRQFGAYPEGVSFAILIMNAFVPLLNMGMKPKRFGEKVVNS